MVEGPGVQPIRVCLERNAQCFKGSVQLSGRKKPLRHLIALSEEFASSKVSATSGRTLLDAALSVADLMSFLFDGKVDHIVEAASWARDTAFISVESTISIDDPALAL